MGLKYENDLLSFLGLKKELLRDDFDFLTFKQSLLLNKDEPSLFDNLITALADDSQVVKVRALSAIYYLLIELPGEEDQESIDLIKSLIMAYDIDTTYEQIIGD